MTSIGKHFKAYLMAAALSLVVSVVFAGCGNPATAPHPGAVNSFDSTTYDALLTVQAGLNTAKAQFGANPAAKVPLNTAIQAYDAAMVAYKAYHTAAATGASTPAQQTALQTQLADVQGKLAAVTVQFGTGGGK